MRVYPENEYDNTHDMRTGSAVVHMIRVQAEQILRETHGVNCRHSAWIEDAKKYVMGEYVIRSGADGQEDT